MIRAIGAIFLAVLGLPVLAQVDFQANLTEGCSPLGVSIEVITPAPGSGSTYFWTITAPDGSEETSNAPLYVAIFDEPGGYDVSLTVDGVDNLTIPDYITVFESPVADYTIDDSAGCFPHCVTFTDQSSEGLTPIVEWVWDFGNGQVSAEQSPSFCYDLPGTFTPVLSIENATGCFDDVSFPGLVFVSDAFPEITVVPDAPVSCNPPADFVFTNTSTGTSALDFAWTFGDAATTSTSGTGDVNHTYNAIGVYNVCVEATDDIGCIADSCFNVEVFGTAQANFTATDVLICEGESVIFEDITFPEPSQTSWDFDGDGVYDATGDSLSNTYDTAGNYTVAVEVFYTAACSDVEYMAIEVVPAIEALFVADTTISCQAPFPVQFTNTSTEYGTMEYAWFIDGVELASTEDFAYTFTDYGSYVVSLEVTNEYNCVSTYTLPENIDIEEPTVTFSTSSTVCIGESVPILGVNVESVDPVVSWFWDFDSDGIGDDFTDDPDYSYDTAGDYPITVEIVTEQGCFGTNTTASDITIQDAVQPEFTVSDTLICAEDEVTFCLPYQPGVTHSWNWGDGSGWDTFNYWDTCVTHNYIDTGWVDITLSIWNGGCNHSGTIDSVLYVNAPIADFNFFHNCVDPMTVNFEDNSIGADSLYWDFGDGSPLVYNILNPSHTYTAEGTYSATLWTYNVESGCSDDRSRTVRVLLPNPTVFVSPTTGCPPLLVSFEEENTLNDYWYVDFGNGVTMEATVSGNTWTVNMDDNGILSSYTQSGSNWWPDVEYNDLGFFDITITTLDEFGCQADTVLVDAVSVSSNPDFADFEVEFIDACDSISVAVTPLNPDDLIGWMWTFSDGTTTGLLTPVHTFELPYDSIMWVSLSGTDIVGCGATSSDTLAIVLPPIPGFTVASDPSCQGEDIQLSDESTGDIVGFFWDFGNPADGANSTSLEQNPVHQYDVNGSFEICLSVENSAGCVQTLCQPNLVNVINPVAAFDFTADINNCLYGVDFESVSEGVVVDTQWDFGDDQIGIGTQVFHTYSIGVYDVEIVVVNDIGCTDTLYVPDILGYGDVIGPYSIELDSVICAPFSVEFEAFNVNDTEFDYFWDYGDGFGNPTGVTITEHLYETPGTYCPELIMTDANDCPVLVGCQEEITVVQLELELPVLDPFCSGDSTVVVLDGASTYTWDEPDWVTQIADDTFLLHPPSTSVLTLQGQFSDCVADTVLNVPILDLPTLTMDMVSEVCFQDAVFALDAGTPVGPTGEYTIDGDPAVSFDPGMNPGESYEVIYTYMDAEGCTNTITQEVMINPLPEVDLPAYQDLCEDDAVVLLGGGLPAGGDYYLDGVPAADFVPATGFGDYEITYIYTDANGCINQDEESIEVFPIPVVEFDLESLCFDGALNFLNTSYVPDGAIQDVDWDFGVLGSSDDYFPGEIGVFAAGSYDITLELTSAIGCDAELTQTFEISPLPEAILLLENDCVGQTFAFAFGDGSTVDSGTIVDWEWDIEGQGLFDDPNFDLAIDEWGAFDVQLLVTTADGCQDSIQAELHVYPYPLIEYEVGGNCEGSPIEFVNESDAPASDIVAYTWDFGDGSATSSDQDPFHTFEEGGTYFISLTAESEYGCESTAIDTLQIDFVPNPDVLFSSEVFCALGTSEITDASTVSGDATINQWTWWIDGNVVSQSETFSFASNTPGTFDLTLEVTSSEGCTATLVAPDFLEVYPIPDAVFTYGPTDADIYDEGIQFYSYSAGAIAWEYDFGDGGLSEEQNPFYTYQDPGTYPVLLTVTNQWGCTDTTLHWVSLSAIPNLFVPNAFTPDNDGVNDVWGAQLYGFDLEGFEIAVYDRWGSLVYTSTSADARWDGSVLGGDHYVMDGVYAWRIKYESAHDGEQHVEMGHVTVVR